ncbi:hypothetical protein [Culicoidibacter larvae]|uniref:Uncharacterized protein n=1 Tax=Culicoidibacter larvae TaxID=2579976 RepID=A0A5R8Q9P8_9FIRM|nr:hypothetical protein [Culicoidibacter larvae]TLG72577.1 hypothetical protein FEZ08_09320 [Culicoidibacter larvae]
MDILIYVIPIVFILVLGIGLFIYARKKSNQLMAFKEEHSDKAFLGKGHSTAKFDLQINGKDFELMPQHKGRLGSASAVAFAPSTETLITLNKNLTLPKQVVKMRGQQPVGPTTFDFTLNEPINFTIPTEIGGHYEVVICSFARELEQFTHEKNKDYYNILKEIEIPVNEGSAPSYNVVLVCYEMRATVV